VYLRAAHQMSQLLTHSSCFTESGQEPTFARNTQSFVNQALRLFVELSRLWRLNNTYYLNLFESKNDLFYTSLTRIPFIPNTR
jgi:hypothetical protein